MAKNHTLSESNRDVIDKLVDNVKNTIATSIIDDVVNKNRDENLKSNVDIACMRIKSNITSTIDEVLEELRKERVISINKIRELFNARVL